MYSNSCINTSNHCKELRPKSSVVRMDCSSTSTLIQCCESTPTKLSLTTSTDLFAPSSTSLSLRFTGTNYITELPITPPTEIRDRIVFRRDPTKVQTVRLNTLGLSQSETIIPPNCLTVEVHNGNEGHILEPRDYVTFELHGSGLKYRAGKKAKESQMDMTFGTDNGMPRESESEASIREYQRQASINSRGVAWDDYDPCLSCGKGRRLPMKFGSIFVLRLIVCCPTIDNVQSFASCFQIHPDVVLYRSRVIAQG